MIATFSLLILLFKKIQDLDKEFSFFQTSSSSSRCAVYVWSFLLRRTKKSVILALMLQLS